MNKYETALFILFIPFYLAAFGLYHFMIFSVNSQLPDSERIPHSLDWRGCNRAKNGYTRLHPKSFVYPLTVACAVAGTFIAIGFVALRFWEYTHGRLP